MANEQGEVILSYVPELNDVSYLKKIRHITNGPWHQYDFLLDSRPYGWAEMLYLLNEVNTKDYSDVQSVVKVNGINGQEIEYINEYKASERSTTKMKSIQAEGSVLAIAGTSRRIGPVKIVLFNQTNSLRMFTFNDNELLVARYAETFIRGTFNTPDEMKLGTPF